MEPRRILVGCTGSVATIKLIDLIEKLREKIQGCEIRIVTTERAKHFFEATEVPAGVSLLCDADEWAAWQGRGDPVLHIELTKWADLFLIAPLDANSLAKIAAGICDNLLLCTVRAWDVGKPLLFAPAMNTKMWTHPVTSRQIRELTDWGYVQIPPISKTLMCGDTGIGAMAEVDTIVERIKSLAL